MLETQIETLLDKVAILRKRHDAITTAIDVMRSTDDEVAVIPAKPKSEHKMMNFKQCEEFIAEQLTGGPMPRKELERLLSDAGHYWTTNGLFRVLGSPQFKKVGERSQIQYILA